MTSNGNKHEFKDVAHYMHMLQGVRESNYVCNNIIYCCYIPIVFCEENPL